jgi:hypothetical protein
MDALAIVEKWIEYAHKAGRSIELGRLWTIRDILEGRLRISFEHASKAVEFLQSCKPSVDKDLIIEALKTRGVPVRDEVQGELF